MQLDALSALNAERAGRRAAILVTDLDGGAQRVVRESEIAADPLADVLAKRLASGKSGLVAVAGRQLFLTVQAPPVRLVIVGAVHISQALCPMARALDLAVTRSLKTEQQAAKLSVRAAERRYFGNDPVR